MDPSGLLLLDKPSGPTSHDMVAALRRVLGTRKVGHTGTLDPLATGLLLVLVGAATRLAPYVREDPKRYRGSLILGLTTDSMDVLGEVTGEGEYRGGPQPVRAALEALLGEREQVPPMFSAVKYRGRPLYRYARRGEEVPRKSRRIRIYEAEMTAFRELGGRAEVDFLVSCSPGTYVRELAASVGETLSCGGTLASLRRTACGPFRVEEALALGELEDVAARGESCLLPPQSALAGYRAVAVSDAARGRASNGSPLDAGMLSAADAAIAEGEVVAVFHGDTLLGMHRVCSASPYLSRAVRMM